MAKPLRYRSLVGDGFWASFRGYPEWLKMLHGRSGVYVIRRRADKRVLYVGESHTARLYETLTRHFQTWGGPTSGPTYSLAAVDVALRLCPSPAAVAAQDRLIRRLKPIDNTQGKPAERALGWNPF